MFAIIPKPNGTARPEAGVFRFAGQRLSVDSVDFAPWCLSAFEARLREKGISLIRGGEHAELRLLRQASNSEESYALAVQSGGITVQAGHERGIIHALTSLYRHIAAHRAAQSGAQSLPCFSLSDEPAYSHRGFMLDCARHFFPPAEIERIIEQMALVKLNVFHWHLSDDQGWRVESRLFPALNTGEFYSQKEIRRICAFARERGVTVIPEIDLPGHTTALLAAYPELSCRGEAVRPAQGAGMYKTILCAGKESVYPFLYSLLDEMCALFDSPFIHLGGDEAPRDEWEQCEHCKEALRKNGLAGFDALQVFFTGRLAEHLAKKGKRLVCWNDVLKAASPPENTDIQYWIDWESGQGTQSFFENGGRVIFSDMFHLYFDYPESFTSLEKVYHYEPRIAGALCAAAPNAAGLEACLWTERVAGVETLEKAVFPRLFALAEAAWTREKNYADFEKRLAAYLPVLAEGGIACTPLDLCNPQGKEREAGIAEFWREFKNMMHGENAFPPAMLEQMLAMLVQGFELPGLPAL